MTAADVINYRWQGPASIMKSFRAPEGQLLAGIMRLNTKTMVLLILCIATLGGVTQGWSAERLFDIYPVPQGNDDVIKSYLVSKTPIGVDRYRVVYRAVEMDRSGKAKRLEKAVVQCSPPVVIGDQGRVKIDITADFPSFAYLTANNLWWAVCRNRFHRF